MKCKRCAIKISLRMIFTGDTHLLSLGLVPVRCGYCNSLLDPQEVQREYEWIEKNAPAIVRGYQSPGRGLAVNRILPRPQ